MALKLFRSACGGQSIDCRLSCTHELYFIHSFLDMHTRLLRQLTFSRLIKLGHTTSIKVFPPFPAVLFILYLKFQTANAMFRDYIDKKTELDANLRPIIFSSVTRLDIFTTFYWKMKALCLCATCAILYPHAVRTKTKHATNFEPYFCLEP